MYFSSTAAGGGGGGGGGGGSDETMTSEHPASRTLHTPTTANRANARVLIAPHPLSLLVTVQNVRPVNRATPKAGMREWIGLAVIALPCLLYSMDLTVLH